MPNVIVDKNKIDLLANAISAKSGEPLTLTLDEMVEAVDGIETSGATPTLETVTKTYTATTSTQTDTIAPSAGYDGIDEVDVTINAIPIADFSVGKDYGFYTENNTRKWRVRGEVSLDIGDGDKEGWVGAGTYYGAYANFAAVPTGTSVTPTESAQTIGGAGTMMEGAVTVNAIPSNYVGSGVTRRSSSDLTASGATVSVPSGFYENNASKAVASGTEGTPTATKGTVTNHSVTVTPSVTNSAGYISGGTHSGTAVTVSASELVSGTYTASASGTADITNYATLSVPSGTAGTPSATKGAVSNHSVSVTPSVTNSTGWITGSTKTGTAVTVTASELVSGNLAITQNGTNINVANYATVSVDVQGGGGMSVATATKTLTSASSSIQFTSLSGQPTSFVVTSSADQSTGGTKVVAVVYDGTSCHGMDLTTQAEADTGFTQSYSSGTLTITATTASFQANEYKLVYTYGGSSANLGTDDVQVGSGATSISFTGLSDEPDYFSCIFTSNFSTSSGYQRVISVVYDGNSTYGLAMDSGAKAISAWTYTYNNGTLTITSSGTNNGGYFHQPGNYHLTYGYGGTVEPTEIEVEPLSVTTNGTYTAPTGKAYTPVTVNVSGGGGSLSYDTKTATASDYPTSLQFTGMKGEPKFFAVRLNAQVSSSGNTTYYYIVDIISNCNGSSATTHGNCFRIGSTRRVDTITSGYSYSYSGTTLTITSSAASRSASPGAFYSGSYELLYAY